MVIGTFELLDESLLAPPAAPGRVEQDEELAILLLGDGAKDPCGPELFLPGE